MVRRLAYRAPGAANLHPADAALNLPAEKHSHGLRRLAATEAARGSFDEAAAALGRATGTGLGKRQVEGLTMRAAADFTAFYAIHRQPAHVDDDQAAGAAGRRQRHRHAPRRAAARDRESRRSGQPEAREPAVQRGEALPQTDRRGRRGRRRDPGRAHRRGHPARHRRRTRDTDRRADGDRQVADGQRRRRRRHRRRRRLRRGHPPRPRPHPHLGRAGRRGEPPDRPDPRRGGLPRGERAHPGRLRPRHRVPVEGDLVLPRRSRPGRRDLGARQSPRRPRRQGPQRRRHHPSHRHQPSAHRHRPQSARTKRPAT